MGGTAHVIADGMKIAKPARESPTLIVLGARERGCAANVGVMGADTRIAPIVRGTATVHVAPHTTDPSPTSKPYLSAAKEIPASEKTMECGYPPDYVQLLRA